MNATIRPNSIEARDIASVIHPYTDLHAHLTNGPMVIARGEGVRVFDEDGRGYIESVAGLWCASLGFNNERLARAAYEQMRALPFYHAFTAKSHDADDRPGGDAGCPRAGADEQGVLRELRLRGQRFSAIKMVWYAEQRVGPARGKRRSLGALKGYHGITIGSASLTGLPANHRSFDVPLQRLPPHHDAAFLPRCATGRVRGRLSPARCADELEKLILAEGPDTVAAMWAEPIMGAGGVIVPPRGYFPKIQAVLKKHDVLFVADEVICGFMRTGNYWGCQSLDAKPDILVCAKALSSSYLPISAVLVNEWMFQALAKESHEIGSFGHGFTYSGHPVPAAVAIETLKIYDEERVLDHVQDVGPHLQSELRRRFAGHEMVGEVRGMGLMAAMELVADKETHANFDTKAWVGKRLVKLMEQNGVIGRFCSNDSLVFSPPLIITRAEIDEMLDGVEASLSELNAQMRQERIAPAA